MKKPLKECANGDGRPVQPPSLVICKECMENIGRKLDSLAAGKGWPKEPQ